MVIPSQTPPFYRALQDAIFLRSVVYCSGCFIGWVVEVVASMEGPMNVGV